MLSNWREKHEKYQKEKQWGDIKLKKKTHEKYKKESQLGDIKLKKKTWKI